MANPLPASRRVSPATIVLILAALIAVGAILYAATRGAENDPAAMAGNNVGGAENGQAGTVEQAIAGLRTQLLRNPDNAEGWAMLGLAYRDTGDARQAADAFRRAAELEPDDPDHKAYLGESLLVLDPVANRQEADRLFGQLLQAVPGDPRVRFYRATMKDMDGNHRGAIDDLLALVRGAPADAVWEPQVRQTIEAIARRNNIDLAGRMPPPRAGAPATAAIPGPTREQMESARSIPPGQQDEMVRGMVDRLAARLRQNPRDAEGWIRLMRSRMVLGDRPAAGAALRSGLGAFQGDAGTQQRLRAAAAELGVPAA